MQKDQVQEITPGEFSKIINDKKIESGSSMDALETMKLVFNIYFGDENWRSKYNIKKY